MRSSSHVYRSVFVAFAILGACQRADVKTARDTATPTTSTDTVAPKITWNADTQRDLTGDGRPDRLSVKAAGPTYDSLRILLEIAGPDGSVRYRDAWSSGLYFVYDYRAGKADTTVERIVKGHLGRLLSDSAFIPASATGPVAIIDSMTIRYDLAEQRVRERFGLSDTSEFTTVHLDSLEKVSVPASEIAQIMQEVRSRPRFRYFAGGEATSIIAWSDRLGRFVRVFSCC